MGIRLRKQLTFSSHLNHIVSGLNRNALSEWRLTLQKSSVCFACDDDGNWAEAVVKRRYGCFVFVHWRHFDAEHDQFCRFTHDVSSHSTLIRFVIGSEHSIYLKMCSKSNRPKWKTC